MAGGRPDALKFVRDRIAKSGGKRLVALGDFGEPEAGGRIAAVIAKECGRLDILVSNAGMNILERSWEKLRPDSIKTMLDATLSSAFYCSAAALEIMRPQKDGLLIHTASWAGRFAGIVPGPAYVAAKHGVVAMSYTINMEEFQHGIRSTVLCPAEVTTPILDLRPTPVPPEERPPMIHPEHMPDLILYVPKLPPTLCMNQVL